MAGLDALWQWALGGLSSVILGVGGVVKMNHDRSKQNKRQLQGDPDDPNAEGVLEISHDTREKVDALEEQVAQNRREMKEEHEAVMERLEDIQGTASGDEHFGDWMSEAVARFAKELEQSVEDGLRRGVDPETLEQILQAFSQELRQRAEDND